MKAEVVESVNGETIAEIAKRTIKPDAQIHTDGLGSYERLSSEGFEHEAEKFDPKGKPAHLSWLHTIISN